MKNDLINSSIASGRLQLNTGQKITHYLPVSIGIIFPLIGLYTILHSYLKNEHIPQSVINPWLWFVSIILTVFIYWLQHKRLKLKTIETSLSHKDSLVIVRAAIDKLNWKTKINNKEIIVVKVFNGLLTGSWGEQVTILFEKNRIYINSICDPDKKSSLASFGNNKKNITALLNEIKR